MRFKADSVVVAIALQCAKLSNPVDNASPHCFPLIVFLFVTLNGVFAMAVTNALFRQKIVPVRVSFLT